MKRIIAAALVILLTATSSFAAIKLRRDTQANWITNNPVLASGEVGLETNTLQEKIGDGATAWNSLGYTNPRDNASVTSAATATGVNIDGADGTRDYNYSNGASAAAYTPVFTSKPAAGKVRGVIATFGGGAGVCTMDWANVTRWIGTTGATTTTTLKRSTYLFMIYNSEVVGKIVQEAY